MNVYHFTYSYPGYNIGDAPSIVDFFCASNDQLSASNLFKEYSNGFEYDNVWVYDQTMDEKIAKDAAYFVYYNQDNAQEADELMVSILRKCPSIADDTLLLEAAQYSTPNALRMILELLPNSTIPSRVLHKSVAHHNEENACILVDSGRVRDHDGWVLAYACGIKKRNLFDIVLPVSNLEAAMHLAPKENFHWLDEAFSVQQKKRLNQAVKPTNSFRARKI